jgi:hypothetical protein
LRRRHINAHAYNSPCPFPNSEKITPTQGGEYPKEARSHIDICGIAWQYYARTSLYTLEIPNEAEAVCAHGDERQWKRSCAELFNLHISFYEKNRPPCVRPFDQTLNLAAT